MANRDRVTRRGFLRGAAWGVAAPYMLTSAALGAPGKRAASDRVNVGKIGCGGRGRGIGGVGGQVIAACDVWKNRREAYIRSGAKAYLDFREMLLNDDIDAVAIATPDHWHVPAAIAAAKAGKDMYVEKPLGVSIHEDLMCREAIHRYGRMFQYGTQQRSSGHCRFGCELVRSGRIGDIRHVHVVAPNSGPGGNTKPLPVPDGLDYDMWLGPARWTPFTGCPNGGGSWYHCYDYALGFIAGWGAHPLDILVWGFDTHLQGKWEVEGTGVIATEGRNDAVYNWNMRIAFESGVTMTFVPGGNYTKFVGTEGWVGISRGGIQAEPASLLKETLGPDDVHLPVSRHHGGNFADAVRTRVQPVSHINDAVRSDLISHVSDIAIRMRRKIVWDPKAETIVGDPEAARMMTRPLRSPWRL